MYLNLFVGKTVPLLCYQSTEIHQVICKSSLICSLSLHYIASFSHFLQLIHLFLLHFNSKFILDSHPLLSCRPYPEYISSTDDPNSPAQIHTAALVLPFSIHLSPHPFQVSFYFIYSLSLSSPRGLVHIDS